MEKFTWTTTNGTFGITVFDDYYGKSIHIANENGIQTYAHKFTGDARERAAFILGKEVSQKAQIAAAV